MALIEAVAWISLVMSMILAITLFVVITLYLRNRKRIREENEENGKKAISLAQVDEAADAALQEINKTSRLVLDEIEERYQSMLFLYNLLEEKKKEVTALVEQAKEEAKASSTARASVKSKATMPIAGYKAMPLPSVPASSPRVSGNARHEKVRALYREGMSIADIAKQMKAGQAEVHLILNVGNR